MIKTVLRLWQTRRPKLCAQREDAETPSRRAESTTPPRPDFALISVDVGNYG
jgi:hypothetical protein